MNKHIARQVANVLAVVATIGINGLANALPLNGQTTGSISDRFRVYFVPAGYVFSIWGLIYLGLIAFAVFQALPRERTNRRLERVGYLFVLSCAANIAWLFLWRHGLSAPTFIPTIKNRNQPQPIRADNIALQIIAGHRDAGIIARQNVQRFQRGLKDARVRFLKTEAC